MMTHIQTLPDGIDLGLAHEINFIIGKFKGLPDARQRELVTILQTGAIDGEEFIEAAVEVFGLISTEDWTEITAYMNEKMCGGELILNGYIIFPIHRAAKARRCALYFRENVTLDDGGIWTIPEIQVPEKTAS